MGSQEENACPGCGVMRAGSHQFDEVFFVFFLAWCPEICARYSPLPSQVVEVYLARPHKDKWGLHQYDQNGPADMVDAAKGIRLSFAPNP